MTHIRPLASADYNAEQKAVADQIASGPRGSVRGPFTVLIHNAKLAMKLQQVGEYLRFQTQLSTKLTEVIILTVARHWSCEHEWYAHSKIARAEGVDERALEAMKRGDTPETLSEDEALGYRAALAILENRELDSTDFKRLEERFDVHGILDIIGLCGYYSSLAMLLNFANNPLPDGAAPSLGDRLSFRRRD